MNLLLDPPRAVGPLTFGMPILEACQRLYAIDGAILPVRNSHQNPGFVHFDSEMSIQVEPDSLGRLRSVEIYRPSRGVQVLYEQISIFDTPADELIAILSDRTRLEIEDGGLRVLASDLLIAFTRDSLEVGSDGVEGRYFASALIARPGYYDEYERAMWPSVGIEEPSLPVTQTRDGDQDALF